MNAIERSKKLRNVRVLVRDVQEEKQVGKFALKSGVREQQRIK
jgi:hypothetical protein